MDEELGGRRREGEKTETVTVGKGQQRQRASVREEMKSRRKEVEKYVMLSRGRNCPTVPWTSVWQAYDQKMKKLHCYFMHNLTQFFLYRYSMFSLYLSTLCFTQIL